MADNRAMLHHGQVSERDVKSASARVAMDDFDGLVSGKMQVLFPAVGGWNIFYTPKEGDHVVMSRLPNGAQEGHILGKVYTANKMPQGGAPDIILLVSDDGKNVVRFDAKAGTLDLICDQKGSFKTKNLDIEVKETTKIQTKDLKGKIENEVVIEAVNNATFGSSATGLVKLGNSIDTVGGLLLELCRIFRTQQTVGSPALHRTHPETIAQIIELESVIGKVLK